MSEHELVIDSFAGGGGASLGIAWALGKPPDVAINHDAQAIAMHAANHPTTEHLTEDVWKAAPRRVTRGRPVGLLWASPDCKHFSRAKGGKPVSKEIRSLAWVVIQWAALVRPRIIMLENVREFADWGPLIPRWSCPACRWHGTEGQALLARHGRRACPRCESRSLQQTEDLVPDPSRKGLTFRRWTGRLRNLGYAVEWRVLDAADYGAPTHRRRLFLVARRDGRPIVWPEPTHGDPAQLGTGLFDRHLLPWRTAAECIDWSIPCPSIFERKRPLAEATLRRIALGVRRYVLENPRPFLVVCNHGGAEFRGQPADQPLPTLTASRDAHALVTPCLLRYNSEKSAGDTRSHDLRQPLGTVVTENRFAVVAPYVARIGQTGGNGAYANAASEPLTTLVSKAEHLLVAPYLVPRYGEAAGQEPRTAPLDAPLGAVTPTANVGSLAAVLLTPMTHGNPSVSVDTPLPTATTQTNRSPLVAAFLAKHFGGVVGVPIDTPLPTTTARATQNQLAVANLVPTSPDEPQRAITGGGNHAALVHSFLTKYFGRGVGQPLDAPLHTATGNDHFGLVTVTIAGESYVIVDIGMRMLRPRELARGQGLPDSYVLTGTATSQVARIGNSVPPAVVEALVRANYAPAAKEVSA